MKLLFQLLTTSSHFFEQIAPKSDIIHIPKLNSGMKLKIQIGV